MHLRRFIIVGHPGAANKAITIKAPKERDEWGSEINGHKIWTFIFYSASVH